MRMPMLCGHAERAIRSFSVGGTARFAECGVTQTTAIQSSVSPRNLSLASPKEKGVTRP